MITRRFFLCAGSAAALSGCASLDAPRFAGANRFSAGASPVMPARYGPIDDEPFPVPAVPPGIVPERYWRQRVENPFPGAEAGTVIVDPAHFFLYLVQVNGTALRYGVGVGRQGFSWSGDAVVQYKRRWPRWKAPDAMVERQPELAPYSVANGGMDPGPENPLGARALYLFQNGEDTLYRIHGNPDASTIGRSVSSGCIRMLSQDVIDLHDRVRNGAKVVVRPSTMPGGLV